jgi:hypothetical protein
VVVVIGRQIAANVREAWAICTAALGAASSCARAGALHAKARANAGASKRMIVLKSRAVCAANLAVFGR